MRRLIRVAVKWPVGDRLRRIPALVATLAASTLLLAGCGTSSGSSESDDHAQPDQAQSPTQDPEDDFQSLQVNMVAPSGTYFPDGVDGMTFGCSDTLVTIGTVPIEAESPDEHVSDAVQFLLDDSQYYHGDPAVTNSLTLSETLELSSVEVGRNTVDIELTGEVVARGECEAYRIQAQMYGTAASTAGLEDVSITVDGTELNEALGLEPFEVGQLSDAGS